MSYGDDVHQVVEVLGVKPGRVRVGGGGDEEVHGSRPGAVGPPRLHREAGELQTSVPTMLVGEPLLAVLLGVIVLGEHVAATGSAGLLLPLAVVAMVAGTVALARDAAAL